MTLLCLAIRTLGLIITYLNAALIAAPYFLLFCKPHVDSDRLLSFEIFQKRRMGRYPIIAEVDQRLTGNISTLRAVSQASLLSTFTKSTNPTKKIHFI